MNVLNIRTIAIGEGMPKICAPLVGTTKEEIFAQARALRELPVDIAEWRADWFSAVADMSAVLEVLRGLREILGETVLLFTFRTKTEGGARAITAEDYAALNIAAAQSGAADLIDVEIFSQDTVAAHIFAAAHEAGCAVIASNHDFEKTPEKDELLARLQKMQAMDADILKLAVMPQNAQDVLTLLAATEEMHRLYADRPIVTMSMNHMGVLSRISGEIFGSAITFGAAEQASAPGQLDVKKLYAVLSALHEV